MSVGSWPGPISGLATPEEYHVSEPTFWRGIVRTVRDLHMKIIRSDPQKGLLIVGPYAGPVGVSLNPFNQIKRRRAFFLIRAFRLVVPGQAVRNSQTGIEGLTVRVGVRFEHRGVKDIYWHRDDASLLHPLRHHQAHKLALWMKQQIYMGVARELQMETMTFPSQKRKGS